MVFMEKRNFCSLDSREDFDSIQNGLMAIVARPTRSLEEQINFAVSGIRIQFILYREREREYENWTCELQINPGFTTRSSRSIKVNSRSWYVLIMVRLSWFGIFTL